MESTLSKRVFLALLAVACLADSSKTAQIRESELNGITCYQLETELMEVIVDPAEGGRVIRLLDKSSGEQLTEAAGKTLAPAGSGIFADRIWLSSGAAKRNYENSAYTVTETSSDAISARITLRCEMLPVTIEKTIFIREGERTVHADYALSNPDSKPFTGSFWSCNVVIPPASEKYDIFLPRGFLTANMTARGPATDNTIVYRKDGQNEVRNNFVNNPEHDYSLIMGDKTAAVLNMPFACLEHAYSFHPTATSQSLLAPTLEWFSLPLYLPPYAEGLAKAVNHPELENPLQEYVYKFTTSVTVLDKAGLTASEYRPVSDEPKLTTFVPPTREMPLYTDFQRGALQWQSGDDKIDLLAVAASNVGAELLEFVRRFPIKLRLVESSHPHVFQANKYLSWTVPDPAGHLIRELEKEPDIILISSTWENVIPEEALQKLLAAVESGTPLIYISHVDFFPSLLKNTPQLPVPDEILAGLPFERLNIEKPRVEVRQYGEGRVYWVKYKLIGQSYWWQQGTALTPIGNGPKDPNLPYWEQYFSFYGRLINHATGKVSALKIAEASADDDTLKIVMASEGAGQAAVKARMDGPDQEAVSELEWQGIVEPGNNQISIPLPREKMRQTGDYTLNLRTSLDGHSQDWCTVVATVIAPASISNLKLNTYAHSDTPAVIRGGVEVTGTGELDLLLRDSYGRVLALDKVTGITGKHEFALTPETSPILPLAELEATLKTDGMLVDRRKTTLTIKTEPFNPLLSFVLWGSTGHAWFQRDADRSLAEIGFTVETTGSRADDWVIRDKAENVMRCGMRMAPMSVHRIAVSSSELKELVRNPCLRDPDYRKKVHEDAKQAVTMAADFFPAGYYCGDENSLGHYDTDHDFCHSSHCLAAFQKLLSQKYSSLEALNESWKSNFSSWEEVRPPTLAEAREAGHFAPWIEHRIFMMDAVSGALQMLKDELAELTPDVRLGFSGQLNTRLHTAFAWAAALQACDDPIAYLRPGDGLADIARSYKRPDTLLGGWIGYGSSLPEIRWNYWRQIANGWFQPSYWYARYFIRRGDSRLSEAGEHMRDLLAEIRGSAADLIFAGSEAENSPFTLVYSIPSFVASVATSHTGVFHPSSYLANFSSWSVLLRDLGYQPPRVLICDDLATSDLSGHEILILPMTQMLDDASVTALVNYVENGGTLIMDAQAGIFNQHVQLRAENPLTDCAGASVEPAQQSGSSDNLMWEGQYIQTMLAGSRVTLKGGTAMASIGRKGRTVDFGEMQVITADQTASQPAMIWAEHGKGKAAYLNFLLTDYSEKRGQSAASKPVREVVGTLINSLKPNLPEPHRLPAGCDVMTYAGHGNRYIAAVRHTSDDPADTQLNLDTSMYVYDVLQHTSLGQMDKISFELPPFGVRTFALLPDRLVPLKGDIQWNGRKFRVILSRPEQSPAGPVALTVESNNRMLRHYSKNHILADQLELEVDPGLIPESGNWRLTVTDLLDGTQLTKEFDLQVK